MKGASGLGEMTPGTFLKRTPTEKALEWRGVELVQITCFSFIKTQMKKLFLLGQSLGLTYLLSSAAASWVKSTEII